MVETHDLFLAEHPVHAKRDAKDIADSAFVRPMRDWRYDLSRYAEAIRDQLQAFQDGTWESTVFSKLFEKTWGPSKQESLRKLIRDSYNSYYEDKERSGVRTIRQKDGTVTPELSFDEDLYAWRPVDGFYEELPEWIELKGECKPDSQKYKFLQSACKQYDDFLHENFHKFIHPNDLMLARLGLGKFEISWDADLKIRPGEDGSHFLLPKSLIDPWWLEHFLPSNPPRHYEPMILPDSPLRNYQRMNQIPLPLRSDWILALATQPMPQMSWCSPEQILSSHTPRVSCY